MLIGEGGVKTLAPLYDIASAIPYNPKRWKKLLSAIKLGVENRLGYIAQRHWERFGKMAGVSKDEMLHRVAVMSDKSATASIELRENAIRDGLTASAVDNCLNLIERINSTISAAVRKGRKTTSGSACEIHE